MENAEDVLHSLEQFSKLKPKNIPQDLEDYLSYVAKTGDPVFKWASVKCLFREKLLSVITEFFQDTLTMELPPCPNVDPFNYEKMKSSLLERLESFHGAPFTVQRISELLTNPRKEYNRADKFMRAVEKNILVVSTREPGRLGDSEIEFLSESSVNGVGLEPVDCGQPHANPDSTNMLANIGNMVVNMDAEPAEPAQAQPVLGPDSSFECQSSVVSQPLADLHDPCPGDSSNGLELQDDPTTPARQEQELEAGPSASPEHQSAQPESGPGPQLAPLPDTSEPVPSPPSEQPVQTSEPAAMQVDESESFPSEPTEAEELEPQPLVEEPTEELPSALPPEQEPAEAAAATEPEPEPTPTPESSGLPEDEHAPSPGDPLPEPTPSHEEPDDLQPPVPASVQEEEEEEDVPPAPDPSSPAPAAEPEAEPEPTADEATPAQEPSEDSPPASSASPPQAAPLSPA